jgi:hypothetical protein
MNYCPSHDWDRYCESENLSCTACGSSEDDQTDCDDCGGVICLNCGYCPDCHKDRQFSVLPEDYFWRTCNYCKQSMNWQDISTFSDVFSGEPVPVHKHCSDAAKAENLETYKDLEPIM